MDKEKVELQLKFTPNYKKYSILLNCYRVGGMKWNDVDGAIFHKIDLSKEDVLFALGVKQQIADLKDKLAESEKDRLMWQEMYKSADKQNKEICETDIYPLQEQVQQLKQQLAEKEKEIEELKKGVYRVTLGTTPSNQMDFTENFYVIQNQTAIDELEKVKEKLNKYNKEHCFLSTEIDTCEKAVEFVDQQIKELIFKIKDKGEK